MGAATDNPEEPRTLPLPARRSGNALPDGTHLAEFELRATLGEGGFGIVYLAWDHSLHRQVAVKEYMPWSLAARSAGARVTPRSESVAETFALGLRSFINEAQLLASFDHPSLLKVHRFWEANGTAYMVMPYYQGVTLKRALAKLHAAPEEGWLLQQLGHLLDALEVMHDASCFHRDIAPDNILLLDEGIPMLLDFGAARRVIGDATQTLTAFLKPGYAPVEQYAEMPEMKQGPWTDLYALASVVHYAITGHTPPESVARLVHDSMVPLARAAAGRYSARFLAAIDHALGVRPPERPQNVAALRAELGLAAPKARSHKPDDIPTAPQPLDAPADASDDATLPPRQTVTARPTAQATSLRQPAAAGGEARRPAGAPRTGVRAAAGVLVALGAVAAGASWWMLARTTAAPPAPPAAAPAPVLPAPAPTAGPGAGAGAGPSTVGDPAGTAAPLVADGEPAAVPLPAASATTAPEETAAPPEVARPAAPSALQRPIPRLSSPDPRCAEIIARVSLGEALTAAERAVLQRECRK